MQRLPIIFALFFVFAGSVHAAETLKPPTSGVMARLDVLDTPKALPEVMLSSAGKGLDYLSEHRGKLVLLNIWATWCPPCIEELPSLNALQRALGGNMFEVVTVSLDTSGPDAVKKYLDDNRLDMLPGFIDVNDDVKKLEVLKDLPGIPITLLIDPQGRALARFQGNADWSSKDARNVLEYYIKNVSYAPPF